MIPSWENMTDRHLNPYSETWQPDEDWHNWYVNPLRNDGSALASDQPVQVAGLLNGNGWTAAFKHAALAGSLGALGGLLLGPVGAVLGIASGLVMSTSALQSQARQVRRLGDQHVTTRSNTREAEDRRTRERIERENAQREKDLEKQRREQEWAQRRREEWDRFVSEKTSVAMRVLQQHNIYAGNITAVGRSKVIIEIPWHIAWSIRRQLIDILESHLQMRTAFIGVRFCDRCGTKLAGPSAEMEECPACKRSFLDTNAPPEPQRIRCTPIKPKAARAPPVSETKSVQETKIDEPIESAETDETPAPEKENWVEREHTELANAIVECQTWDPLSVDDYQEDVDLTPLMKHLSAKLLPAKTPHTNAPVPARDIVPKTELLTRVMPRSVPHKPINMPIAPEQESPASSSSVSQPVQPPVQAETGKGDIVIGRHVQCLGRYKGFTGIAQLVDKKKRVVKVLLDKYAVSVSIAIELVVPLEEAIAQ